MLPMQPALPEEFRLERCLIQQPCQLLDLSGAREVCNLPLKVDLPLKIACTCGNETGFFQKIIGRDDLYIFLLSEMSKSSLWPRAAGRPSITARKTG